MNNVFTLVSDQNQVPLLLSEQTMQSVKIPNGMMLPIISKSKINNYIYISVPKKFKNYSNCSFLIHILATLSGNYATAYAFLKA